jgi:hypothetical protein
MLERDLFEARVRLQRAKRNTTRSHHTAVWILDAAGVFAARCSAPVAYGSQHAASLSADKGRRVSYDPMHEERAGHNCICARAQLY